MTYKELAELQRRNPDIVIHDPDRVGKFAESPTSPPLIAAKITEHELQTQVIVKCDERAITDYRYGLIYANVNGQYRPGTRMEAGLRPGIPDLFLPCACGGYHGLYIELKVKGGEVRQSQLEWASKLKREGYRVVVVWDSVGAAMAEIDAYLGAV